MRPGQTATLHLRTRALRARPAARWTMAWRGKDQRPRPPASLLWTTPSQARRQAADRDQVRARRRPPLSCPSWDEPGLKATYDRHRDRARGRRGRHLQHARDGGNGAESTGGLKRVRFAPHAEDVVLPAVLRRGRLRHAGFTAPVRTQVSAVKRAQRGGGAGGRMRWRPRARCCPSTTAYFGAAYPLPKLDLIAAPGAGSFGAMENWGAIFFFDNAPAGRSRPRRARRDRRGVWSR